MHMFKYGKTVGEFTKRYRQENSMTQGDLANKLGVNAQYVSNIERGVHKGAISFAMSLSKIVKGKDMAKHLCSLALDERLDCIVDRMEE